MLTGVVLELGPGLDRLVRKRRARKELAERLVHVRRRVSRETAVAVPEIEFDPNGSLQPDEYVIRIDGVVVARGTAFANQLLRIGESIDGLGAGARQVADPIYGTPSAWLEDGRADDAAELGLQTFDVQDVITTHVAEAVKQHLVGTQGGRLTPPDAPTAPPPPPR